MIQGYAAAAPAVFWAMFWASLTLLIKYVVGGG